MLDKPKELSLYKKNEFEANLSKKLNLTKNVIALSNFFAFCVIYRNSRNSRFESLTLNYLIDSFIAENLIKFDQAENESISINSSVSFLVLSGYGQHLDESILNPLGV